METKENLGSSEDKRIPANPITTPEELWRALRGLAPVAIVSLGALAILYTLYFAAELFLPIFFAAFFAILLKPVVQSLSRIGLPRPIAAFIVLIGLVGSIVAATVNLSGPVESWFERLPGIQRQIETKLWPVTKSIKQAQETTEKIQNIADGDSKKARDRQVTIKKDSLLSRLFQTTWLTFVQFLITLAVTFLFLARNGAHTTQQFKSLPWRQYRSYVEDFLELAQERISRFVRVSAVIYLCIGTLTGLAMYVLGMPNPLLWGVMATVLGFMPYVGPLVVTGCIGVASLLTFSAWWEIAAPPLVYGAMTIIEGYFITPAILGRHLTLSPISVFLSMLLWTWLWGMPGAFLSVPIVVIATLFARHLLLVLPKDEAAEDLAGTLQR
jgi:predicted PurR-regulated permease PerM